MSLNRYAECRHADCRGATAITVGQMSVDHIKGCVCAKVDQMFFGEMFFDQMTWLQQSSRGRVKVKDWSTEGQSSKTFFGQMKYFDQQAIVFASAF